MPTKQSARSGITGAALQLVIRIISEHSVLTEARINASNARHEEGSPAASLIGRILVIDKPLMLTRRTVSRFNKRLEDTRTRPAIVVCEDEEGNETEFYLKLRAAGERGAIGLACEIIANQLAGDLGIPTPDACLLEVTPELADSIPDKETADVFRKSCGWNFGSAWAGPSFRIELPDRPILPELRQTSLEIFAFDALIQNSDRHAKKPNCLSNGQKILAIDHELAFDFVGGMVLFWKPPWDGGLGFLRNHLYFERFRKQAVDFSRMSAALAGLSSAAITGYGHSVPAEWTDASDAVSKILEYLVLLTENIPATIDGLERLLK